MAKKIHPLKSIEDTILLKQKKKLKSVLKTNADIDKRSIKVQREIFKKSVKIKTAVKPIRLYYFPIAGMRYIFKDIKSFEKIYDSISEGDSLTLKHEFKNKFDPCACEIIHNNKKLGYIPKEFNFEILELSQKGFTFLVLIHKMHSFSEFYDAYKCPEVVIMVYK